jgi:hypothetical protein
MAQPKNEIHHFADNFMHHLVNEVVFDKESDYGSTMETILKERKILFRLHELDELSEQDKISIRDYVLENWSDFLNESDISPEQQDAFVNTLFFDEGSISDEEQERYKKVIETFQQSQSINDLYFFGGVLTDTPDEFEDTLKNIFQQLEYSQKAEVLANLSVFIENYNKTALGKKFINSIDEKNTQQWFSELIDNMKGHSPLPFLLDYDPNTNAITYKEQGKGLYDGLFFLPVYNDSNQLQISATAQFSSKWEGSSIQRHMLSNSIIGKALNQFFYDRADGDEQTYRNKITGDVITDPNERLNAQIHSYITYGLARKKLGQDANGQAYNQTMADTIVKAVNQFLDESFDDMESMVRQLNQAPLHYIRKAIGDNSNDPITKKDLDYFINNNDVFVTSESFFLSHVPAVKRTENAKASPLWKKEFDTNNFSPEEFRVKSQCLGFLGEFIDKTAKNQGEIDLDAVYNLFEAKLKIRVSTRDDTIHNDKFVELNLKDFEAAVMRNFVLNDPKEINQNHLAIDQTTRENINSYLKAFLDYHNEASFKQKMNELGIDNPLTFERAIDNLGQSQYNDWDLEKDLRNKGTIIKQDKKGLINQALSIKIYEPDEYKDFIKNSDIDEKTQQLITYLFNENYNGVTRQATIDLINKTLEMIDINDNAFHFPDSDAKSLKSNDTENKIEIQNNGKNHKPK